MTITFLQDPATVPTAQQKGIRVVKGIPMFYKKKPLLEFEKNFTRAVDKERNGYRIPDGEAVYLHITFLFGYPHSTPKSRRIDMAPMTQRPDGDNLIKAIVDCLGDRYAKDGHTWKLVHQGVFADDAQITPWVISKFRTTGTPRIVVTVCPRADWIAQMKHNPSLMVV